MRVGGEGPAFDPAGNFPYCKNMKRSFLLPGLLAVLSVVAIVYVMADEKSATSAAGETVIPVLETAPRAPAGPVEKSDEEWRKILTPEQYRILREAGTERANGKAYEEFKHQGGGTYYCAGCGAELFTSDEKFDSHCGWPSFYDPSKTKNVKYNTDFHLGYARTEVVCKICEGHLGHVFEGEGFETPTDKRYCINGTVLKFVPAAGKEEKKSPESEKPKD
jgi:peptide-methionine (R)-S-oxide reductase